MEKSKSFWRRSLLGALNLPWFAGKDRSGFSEKDAAWQPVQGRSAVGPVFTRFTDNLAAHCADMTATAPDAPWLWERGSLDSGASYFYYQRFDEEGMLIEQTANGWFSIPAVKVVADDSFIRGQIVAETAAVVVNSARSDEFYVRSTIIGKEPVLLALYADTFIEAFG